MAITLTKQCVQLNKALENKRAEYIPLWKEVRSLLAPEHGQFVAEGEEPNRLKDYGKIYGQAPKTALQILAGGLQSMIPRNQQWLKVGTSDPAKTEYFAEFFEALSERVLAILELSNFYAAMNIVFNEVCAFGIGSHYIQEHPENLVWFRPLTIGEYSLGVDEWGSPDTITRSFYMSPANVMNTFNKKDRGNFPENIPDTIKQAFEQGKADEKIKILHVIKPNSDRAYGKIDRKNKKYQSVYLLNDKESEAAILRVSGYDSFPTPTMRWKVVGSDIYSTSPGIQVLYDIKTLYKEIEAKGDAINHQADPALNVTPDFQQQLASFRPGAVFTTTDLKSKVSPVLPPNHFDLNGVMEDIKEQKDQIAAGFMNPLFLMPEVKSNMTAFEFGERIAQKDAQLGQTVNKIETDLLDPTLDRVVEIMFKTGIMPDIPPELGGADIKFEYISMLSRASREVDKLSIGEAVKMFGSVADLRPDVLPLLNAEETMRKFLIANGAPAKIVYDQETYQELLMQEQEKREQEEQEAMAMQQAAMVVDGVEKLSKADTSGKNALTDIAEAVT